MVFCLLGLYYSIGAVVSGFDQQLGFGQSISVIFRIFRLKKKNKNECSNTIFIFVFNNLVVL